MPAIAAGLAELNDEAFLAESRRVNAASKKIIVEALAGLGMRTLPSQTNFVFAELPKGVTLEAFAGALKEKFVMVGRPFPPATNWVRISMVSEADSAYMAEQMKALRAAKKI